MWKDLGEDEKQACSPCSAYTPWDLGDLQGEQFGKSFFGWGQNYHLLKCGLIKYVVFDYHLLKCGLIK